MSAGTFEFQDQTDQNLDPLLNDPPAPLHACDLGVERDCACVVRADLSSLNIDFLPAASHWSCAAQPHASSAFRSSRLTFSNMTPPSEHRLIC